MNCYVLSVSVSLMHSVLLAIDALSQLGLLLGLGTNKLHYFIYCRSNIEFLGYIFT